MSFGDLDFEFLSGGSVRSVFSRICPSPSEARRSTSFPRIAQLQTPAPASSQLHRARPRVGQTFQRRFPDHSGAPPVAVRAWWSSCFQLSAESHRSGRKKLFRIRAGGGPRRRGRRQSVRILKSRLKLLALMVSMETRQACFVFQASFEAVLFHRPTRRARPSELFDADRLCPCCSSWPAGRIGGVRSTKLG